MRAEERATDVDRAGARDVAKAAARSCPLCGGYEQRRAFRARDWFLGALDGEFTYVRCLGCRTVFIEHLLGPAVMAQAHSGYHTPVSEKRTPIERLAEKLAMREARELVSWTDPSRPLVDIGCGSGLFIERLRRAGWSGQIRGVEPSEQVALDTQQRLGITVEIAVADDLPLADDSAGTIVMRHVIEHVRDQRGVVRRVHAILERGGFLYLATPDLGALAATAFGRFWHGYDPPRHSAVMEAAGVRRLLVENGFEVRRERWGFSPEMWTGSLHHVITGLTGARRAADVLASNLNPIAAAPAALAALVEWRMRRSTMYGVMAERVE